MKLLYHNIYKNQLEKENIIQHIKNKISMKRIFFYCLIMAFSMVTFALTPKKQKMIDIAVDPKEASIYINNTFLAYGSGQFPRPRPT